MNIEQKMNYVVKKVLGEGYSVIVWSDYEYKICIQGDVIIHSEGMKNINNHWREVIGNGINVIIASKLKAALNEV